MRIWKNSPEYSKESQNKLFIFFFLLFSGTTFLQNLYMVYIPTKRIVIHENLVENVLHFPKYTQNDFFLQTIV